MLGYCEKTGQGLTSDDSCMTGSKGYWDLTNTEVTTWKRAGNICAKLCALCDRCNHISFSIQHKDCSWFNSCDVLHHDVSGFKTLQNLTYKIKSQRNYSEAEQRKKEIIDWMSTYGLNTSGFLRLYNHPLIQSNIHTSVRLNRDGSRLRPNIFSGNSLIVYNLHNKQTASERAFLAEKWRRPLFGRVKLFDLLLLLHFTIDHTDNYLMYTSQFIHCLQVYTGIRQSDYKNDPVIHKQLMLAALIHDIGKLLTLFGEEDANVDCMNRIVNVNTTARGLVNVQFQWNHDAFGYHKLKDYVPPMVQDILLFHSLREVSISYPNQFVSNFEGWQFLQRLNSSEVLRIRNVEKFQVFDATTKFITNTIPSIDMNEVNALISEFFTNGNVVF
tara:strand:+ start:77 stop:1234 length:1158 start_codon:yes stop_codon:yes gene_type:complete